ncbi:hypothetical protein [Vibrio sp. WXL103]|uniref:hypothetical protein n=1 Tax=unclassified Vibrio TaxID=2614977 RepID=UPI003EC60BC8
MIKLDDIKQGLKVKKVRMMIAAGLGALMIITMLIQQLTTPPKSAHYPVAQDETQEFDDAAYEPFEEVMELDVVDEPEQASIEVVAPHDMLDAPLPQTKPQPAEIVEPQEPVPAALTFALSTKTQDILTAKEEVELSKLKQAQWQAQVQELQAFKELNDVVNPPAPPKSNVHAEPPLISLIKVESIISTPSHTTAWLKVGNDSFPVRRGARIQDWRVLEINKDHLTLMNKQGHEVVRYVEKAPVIVQEDSDGRDRERT